MRKEHDIGFSIAAWLIAAGASTWIIDLRVSGFTAGLCGTALLYVVCFHRRRDLLQLVFATAALVLLRWRLGAPAPLAVIPLPLAGAAGITLIAGRWARARGEERARLKRILVPIAAIFAFGPVMKISLILLRDLQPLTYDGRLFLFDRKLGFDPAYQIGRLVYSSRFATYLCMGFYEALPLGLFLILADRLRDGRSVVPVLTQFALGAVLALCGYIAAPAIGPLYAFAGYPWTLPIPQLAPMTASTPAARNCVPSMHFTWALLLFRNSAGWQRVVSVVFVCMTFLATLGLGQHYLFDLAIAAPFATFLACLVAGDHRRAIVCGAICAGGIGAVRAGFLPPPMLAWAFLILCAGAGFLRVNPRSMRPSERNQWYVPVPAGLHLWA